MLKDELQETKEHLKKYTSPIQNKIYYEKNKDKHKHKQMVKEYKENLTILLIYQVKRKRNMHDKHI